MRIALAAVALSSAIGCAHPRPVVMDSPSSDLHDIEQLENMRDLGNGALTGWLKSSDPARRQRAALALGRIADEASFPALRAALVDPDPSVRAEAAFALGVAGDEGAAAALGTLATTEPDQKVRADALESLGRVGSSPALPALAQGLTDPRPAIREGALRGLLFLAVRKVPVDDAASRALSAARDAPEPELRFLALYALGRITAPETARPAMAAALRQTLPDDDAEATAMRLKALARLAEATDAEAVAGALAHPDWRVRTEAARALAACGPDAADRLAAWILTAKDPSPHPVSAALEALGPHAARPRVLQMAQRLAPRCEAVALLERAGQRAAALACDAPPFRRKILHAQILGALPAVASTMLPIPPSAGQTLAPPLDVPARLGELALVARDGDPRVRTAAVSALGEIDMPITATLLREALGDPDPAVLGAAADAIRRNADERKRPDREAVPNLVASLSRLQSPAAAEAMIAILGALGALGDPRAVATVRWARSDQNFSVRKAAREALAALGDASPPPAPRPPPPTPTPGDAEALRGRNVSAVLVTSRGEIEIALHPDDAPFNAASLVFLAGRGFWKGLTFHRVVPDFVIQGGDPRGDGTGGPGYDLRCEYGRRRFRRGSVGIALAGRDTGGSQLFITHLPAPHLDGRFTVVGQVVRGQEVVDAIVVGDTIADVRIEASP